MYVRKVLLKMMLVLEHPRANVTLEGLDVTNTMDSRQMTLQLVSIYRFLAANLALERSFTGLSSYSGRVRRVVVSADR